MSISKKKDQCLCKFREQFILHFWWNNVSVAESNFDAQFPNFNGIVQHEFSPLGRTVTKVPSRSFAQFAWGNRQKATWTLRKHWYHDNTLALTSLLKNSSCWNTTPFGCRNHLFSRHGTLCLFYFPNSKRHSTIVGIQAIYLNRCFHLYLKDSFDIFESFYEIFFQQDCKNIH